MAWDTGLASPHLDIAAYQGSPLRVMAGPGTGKTFALMRRVARLLESGVAPDSILAVSFTRTAANDLIDKLKKLSVSGAGKVKACTLHSLCFELLAKNTVFQTTNRVPRPLMEFEGEPVVADLAAGVGGKEAAKDLLKAFLAYWATLQHHQPGWPQDAVQQDFHRQPINWLTFHQAMLIGELVSQALDYITRNPASPAIPHYAHVLADEYQDLNRADQALIDALAQHGTLTVAGDEDQSIYTRLRHARPEGIVQFHQTHPKTHDVPLSDCKRCPPQVIQMANSLILRNHPSRPSTIRPGVQNGGEVYIVQHNSLREEITSTAAFVDWYLGSHPDVKPGEVLVLTTRARIGYEMRDELNALGRPTLSFFTEDCLKKPSAREGFCLLTLLARPDDRSALRAWLGLGHNDWRTNAYDRVWQAAQSSGISPKEFLDRILGGLAQPLPHTSDLVRRHAELSAQLKPLAGIMGPGLVEMLWPPNDPDCEDIRSIGLAVAATAPSPAEILNDLVAAITQPELPGDSDDIIRVMSLHKSKGLTAKCVLVTGCVAGALPTLGAGLSSTERQLALEEQRRLFYVAITRTSQTLVLSSSAKAPYGDAKQMGLTVTRFAGRTGDNAILQASPFLSELGQPAPRPLSGNQWRSSVGF